MSGEQIAVTQADRDAAAILAREMFQISAGVTAEYLNGHHDREEFTQTFARHRHTTTEQQAARIAQLEADLARVTAERMVLVEGIKRECDWVADWARRHEGPCSCGECSMLRLAENILALASIKEGQS